MKCLAHKFSQRFSISKKYLPTYFKLSMIYWRNILHIDLRLPTVLRYLMLFYLIFKFSHYSLQVIQSHVINLIDLLALITTKTKRFLRHPIKMLSLPPPPWFFSVPLLTLSSTKKGSSVFNLIVPAVQFSSSTFHYHRRRQEKKLQKI